MTDDNDTRYDLPLCNAMRTGRSSSGPGRCRNIAGMGTDHLGRGRCKWHLGNSANHQIADISAEVNARAAQTYGEPIDIDPGTALLQEVHRTSGHVAWLNGRLAEASSMTDRDAQVIGQLYIREREHLTRVCKTALDAGIAERHVRLAEQQGQLIAHVVIATLHDLGLSSAQMTVARGLVGTKLRELSSASTASG